MSKISKLSVLDGVQEGIVEAYASYMEMSGLTLYDAPEYFLTVAIAKKIKSLGNCWVTLEDNVHSTLGHANSKYIGRPRAGIRRNGRFDIVLWLKKGLPRAIIEVKHPLYQPIDVFVKDIERLRDVIVTSRRATGTFEFGCLGFWMDAANPHRKHNSPEHRIEERFNRLVEVAGNCVAGKSELTVRRTETPTIISSQTENGESWAWGACCITIE